MLKMRKLTSSSAIAIALALGLVSFGGVQSSVAAQPRPAGTATVLNTIYISAYCTNQAPSWTATSSGNTPNSSVAFEHWTTFTYDNGTQYQNHEVHGNLTASASGWISTPSFFSQADSSIRIFQITVKIGSVYETKEIRCH